jgi:hypothetical protein
MARLSGLSRQTVKAHEDNWCWPLNLTEDFMPPFMRGFHAAKGMDAIIG